MVAKGFKNSTTHYCQESISNDQVTDLSANCTVCRAEVRMYSFPTCITELNENNLLSTDNGDGRNKNYSKLNQNYEEKF